MTYPVLNAVFLVLAMAVLLTARLRRAGRPRAVPLALAAAALLVLTAVFDNVMIAAGLFAYAPELRSGLSIGRAPLEDFAYPLAGVLALPALWELLGPRSPRAPTSPGHGRGPTGPGPEPADRGPAR